MEVVRLKFLHLYRKMPKKFIIAGIINTIFGYLVSIINLHFFLDKFNLILIGIVNNFLSITFAFFLLKKFVFPTRNTNWLNEYIRSFIVYGFKAIMGIFILWFLINLFNLNIFLSQGLSMILTFFFTYKAHKKFTFRV